MIQRLGLGTLMAKPDIKSAFSLCPVHPDDFNLLGINFRNKYWIQKMLPQGCSISPAIFEKFSTFVQYAVSKYSNSDNIDHYLDDFFFAGKGAKNDRAELIKSFEHVCNDIKIPINHEKSEGPVTILEKLGLEIDTTRMEIRVPENKILKTKSQIMEARLKKKITLTALQSLLGTLNFFTKVINTGRTFNCRLYQTQSQSKLPHHFIRLTKSLKEDSVTWLFFLFCSMALQ